MDLPSETCPQCEGRGYRYLRNAGAWLREVRLAYGISVKRMALSLAISDSTLCDWEAGRRRVPRRVPEKLERVCKRDGRQLPPNGDGVEARPEAPAEAPEEPPLRQDQAAQAEVTAETEEQSPGIPAKDVDEPACLESLPRSQPRTLPDWSALAEQQRNPNKGAGD